MSYDDALWAMPFACTAVVSLVPTPPGVRARDLTFAPSNVCPENNRRVCLPPVTIGLEVGMVLACWCNG